MSRVMCWHSFSRRRWINPRTSCLKKCFYFEAATGNMVFFFSPVASVLFVTSDFCFQILKNSPCSYRGNRKCHQTKQDWNPEDYNFYYSFKEYAVLCSVNVFMCQGSGCDSSPPAARCIVHSDTVTSAHICTQWQLWCCLQGSESVFDLVGDSEHIRDNPPVSSISLCFWFPYSSVLMKPKAP